jgi:hypothetical protein
LPPHEYPCILLNRNMNTTFPHVNIKYSCICQLKHTINLVISLLAVQQGCLHPVSFVLLGNLFIQCLAVLCTVCSTN